MICGIRDHDVSSRTDKAVNTRYAGLQLTGIKYESKTIMSCGPNDSSEMIANDSSDGERAPNNNIALHYYIAC